MAAVADSAADSLIACLHNIAKTAPQAEAIVTSQYSLTYLQLINLIIAQSQRLSELSVTDNSVVGIKCAEDTQHLILCLASSYLGASSFTIPTYEPEQLQQSLTKKCKATHLLDTNNAIDLNTIDSEKKLIPSFSPARSANFLFSSSGTTGDAKLIVHQDTDIVAQAYRHINSAKERFGCLASVEHNFAKRHRLYCLAQGATNIFLDANQNELVQQCEMLNVNVLHVSVFQAQQLLVIPNISALSNIRLKLGGSHATIKLRQELKQTITKNLQAGYGTTETGAICFTESEDTDAGESVGKPLPGIEIRVVSKQRQVLPLGQKGELAIRCKGMFRAYLGKAELTASSLENNWFYTGDIGYLDEQQRVYLCGRADDMFVFNSINIFPQEIESLLRQHQGVLDIAVIPKQSPTHGSIPVALLVLDDKDKLEELKVFARANLGLRCPQDFILVDEIPRNAAGKISRLDAQRLSLQSNELRAAIIKNLSDSLALNNIKVDVINSFEQDKKDIYLHEIGMDSIVQMGLLVMLETTYDTVITPQQYTKLKSLNDIVAFVLAEQEHKSGEKDNSVEKTENIQALETTVEAPYIVKFFRKVFHYCKTVAQLNKALTSFEYRLTPVELQCLYDWHQQNNLIPLDIEEKFHAALGNWLSSIRSMMQESGKQEPESFVSRRIKPMLTHFTGTGIRAEKTLVICFSIARSRQLAIPNTVLMQHADAKKYDLLIVATPSMEGFYYGSPLLGKNEMEIIEFLLSLDFIKHYKNIRTIGGSAGAPIAVLLARRLNAELAVSLGARFHKHRFPLRILKRFYAMYKGMHKLQHTKVIFAYSVRRRRDRHFAKLMNFLFTGILFAIQIEKRKFSHTILEDLLALHKLNFFFECTIFAESVEHVVSEDSVLSFPSGKLEAMN